MKIIEIIIVILIYLSSIIYLIIKGKMRNYDFDNIDILNTMFGISNYIFI